MSHAYSTQHRRRQRIAAALAFALAVPSMAPAADESGKTTAIVNAVVFDATGTEPYRGALVIKDGRIVQVGPDVKPPKGATVIDAKGQALLPGLFDLHTHWTPGSSPASTLRSLRPTWPLASPP